MSVVIRSEDDYQIDFSFFPSITNIRRFALIGRKVVEMFWPDDNKMAFEIEVCLMEAFSNAFYHGGHGQSNKRLSFQIKKHTDRLVVRIFDQGKGFSLSEQLKKKIQPFQTTGRGLFLLNRFADRMKYKRGARRNELILEKMIPSVVEK